MAGNSAARVTGLVLKTNTRSGAKAQPDGSLKNWAMHSARVLVGGEDICDVSYQDDGRGNPPAEFPGRGETVDVLVSIRAGGNFLNIDYVSDWTERHTAASA